MNNMPTSEEFFEKYSNLYSFEEGPTEYLIDKEDFKTALTEFTKLHVEAALQAAANQAEAKENTQDFGTGTIWVDKDSILEAYPLTLIV